ncbi:TrbI/VirB10 family protein [Suttonella ornithocola]|uniref:Type IV secretion system protein virB10 n=1 Tax=Suttonella ornithocola TaxID=279832 RepID=A0A380MV05_9GAMM|nr:TrbI/VirB10 family protein [Suttonella ornithocola]SUO96102.1 Type IV secretion system protein virB10 [Suttonella ornithocola]
MTIKVTGEYRGDVKNGDRRLQIIWDRLITPYDVVVQLQSPTTDRLGASGITGKVDNRWGLRIGSALLVSIMSDALNIAGKNSKSADVIVESDTADTSNDIAKKILEKNIDLSPIIYLREGEMINIYVADDIDLSSVYNARQLGY